MDHKIDPTNKRATHIFCFDNDAFRLIKKDLVFFNSFFEHFESNYPELLENYEINFSLQQLLEDVNCGKIISKKIKNDVVWQDEIKHQQINNYEDLLNLIDQYWDATVKRVCALELMESESLSKLIAKSIEFGSQHTHVMIELTLGKANKFIETKLHKEHLSYVIAWALITSHNFISPSATLISKEQLFETLLAGWYKCYRKGVDLDLYRIIDTKYQAAGDPEADSIKIKPESDLCDSDIISAVMIGVRNEPYFDRIPVIGIMFVKADRDPEKIILKYTARLSVARKEMADIRQKYTDWTVNSKPGKIIILIVNDQNEISNSHVIEF